MVALMVWWCVVALRAAGGGDAAAGEGERSGGGSAWGETNRVLRTAREVRVLSPAMASRRYPIRLRGVVTYFHQAWGHLVVQDETEGVFAFIEPGQPAVEAGDVVDVEGVSDPGEFSPVVGEARYRFIERGSLPVAPVLTVDALLSGRMDSQWVEVQGIVRAVSAVGGPWQVDLASGERVVRTTIPNAEGRPLPEHLVDAEVRVRAVCGTEFNRQRQRLGVQLLCPGLQSIEVVRPAVSDPFGLPVRGTRSLFQFSTEGLRGHRVRVQGVVTLVQPGVGLYLVDGEGSLLVRAQPGVGLARGDKVEVVGFPVVADAQPQLEHAVVRKLGVGKQPSIREVVPSELNADLTAVLVTLEGVVRQVRPGDRVVDLEGADGDFVAVLVGGEGESLPQLKRGTRVRVTGVHAAVGGEAGGRRRPRVLMGSAEDMRVVARAPWLTAQRMGQALVGMGLVLLLGSSWVVALRRQVRRQTGVIRQRLEQEAALQESYRLVWETSVDGMRLTDADGRMVRVNEAFCRLVGKARSELEGQLMTVVYAAEEAESVLERYRDRYSQRALRFRSESCRRLWDGRQVWLEVSNSFLAVEGQAPLVLSLIRDVTQRKRMEQRLIEAQKLESLGVLAGGIAHDFNNLLTSILGNVGLAAADVDPGSPVRECLREIEATSRQAAKLCQQMLAYSGRGRFQVQLLDLNALLEEMRPWLQTSVGKAAVLRFDLAASLPVVEGDSAQLRQVVANLVTNAAEAMDEKSGEIVVRTGSLVPDAALRARAVPADGLREGEHVFVEVTDTGGGMTAETLARLFDPFFTTKFTGRGLGLSAVLGVARGHGGALVVESELGRGSAFRFLLPAAGGCAAPAVVPVVPGGSVRRRHGAVLVVDDEDFVRRMLGRALQATGFEVLVAEDGEAGLRVFEERAADLRVVLLDLTMPKMSGVETFQRMRALNAKVPVVLVSGYSEEEATARFTGTGLAGFLQKPFTVESLRAKIEEVVA